MAIGDLADPSGLGGFQTPAAGVVGKLEQPCEHVLKQRATETLALVGGVDSETGEKGDRLCVTARPLAKSCWYLAGSELGHAPAVVADNRGTPGAVATKTLVVPVKN